MGTIHKAQWVRSSGRVEPVDSSDIERVRRAQADWKAAEQAAVRAKAAFLVSVRDFYDDRSFGDIARLAKVLGKTPKQVKRYAEGTTSGNPPRGKSTE